MMGEMANVPCGKGHSKFYVPSYKKEVFTVRLKIDGSTGSEGLQFDHAIVMFGDEVYADKNSVVV